MAELPALCTSPQATCLNAWDVMAPNQDHGGDPAPVIGAVQPGLCSVSAYMQATQQQPTNSVAVAAALRYRQMKQQQEEKQKSVASSPAQLASTSPPESSLTAITATTTLAMTSAAPPAAWTAAAAGTASRSSSGSSVSSLYGKLRSASALAQPSAASAAAAAAAAAAATAAAALRSANGRCEIICKPPLLCGGVPADGKNNCITTTNSCITSTSGSQASNSAAAAASAASTDVLSLLLAAASMSSQDAPAVELPCAPNAESPAMWNSNTNSTINGTFNSATSNSAHMQLLHSCLSPERRMQVLQQLQQLQVSHAASSATTAAAAAAAPQFGVAMHAPAATAAAPPGLQVVDYDCNSLLQAAGQVNFMQQQQQQLQQLQLQQLQAFSAAGLQAGVLLPSSHNNNAAPSPTEVFQYNTPAARPAAAGPVYVAEAGALMSHGMLHSQQQQQQQQVQYYPAGAMQSQQQLQLQPAHLGPLGSSIQTAAGSGNTVVDPFSPLGMVCLSGLQGMAVAGAEPGLLGSICCNGSGSGSNTPCGTAGSVMRADKHASASATAQHNPLYKTELCRSWLDAGSCRYGARCQFAHGQIELRPVLRPPKYKTQPCRTYSLTRKCPYGARCNFIHDEPHRLAGLTGSVLLASASSSSSASKPAAGNGNASADGKAAAGDVLTRTSSCFSTSSTGCSGGGAVSNTVVGSTDLRISSGSGCTDHSRSSSMTGLPGSSVAGMMMGSAISSAAAAAAAALCGGGGAAGSGAAKDASGQLRALLMQLPVVQPATEAGTMAASAGV